MKNRIKQFLTFFRNFLVVSYAWLVLLVALLNASGGNADIKTATLFKLFAFCVGVALIFSVSFSNLFVRKKSFMLRLTIFVILFIPFEIACFYSIGLFTDKGSTLQWFFFVGIIVICYILSLILDFCVFRRQGKEYTALLEAYQRSRT